MTIEEAYEAMKEGHKVAHSSYDEDEFNYIQSQMEVIYDENKYRWGYKYDTPWDMRVNNENGWFDKGWFVCNERKFKERHVPTYQKDFLIAMAKDHQENGEMIIAGKPRKHMTTMVAEKVDKEEKIDSRMRPTIPSGYKTALENVRAMAENFNVNKNEYAGNRDGSQGFSAKKNRELNRERRFQWN